MGNGAAAVIVDERGRVLLVKHTYGRLIWELSGGNAEPGESAEATALRAVLARLGFQAVSDQGTYTRFMRPHT